MSSLLPVAAHCIVNIMTEVHTPYVLSSCGKSTELVGDWLFKCVITDTTPTSTSCLFISRGSIQNTSSSKQCHEQAQSQAEGTMNCVISTILFNN